MKLDVSNQRRITTDLAAETVLIHEARLFSLGWVTPNDRPTVWPYGTV